MVVSESSTHDFKLPEAPLEYVDELMRENRGLRELVSDMFLTWKRLDLEGDWPASGHNGWKTFERRMAEFGIEVME